MTLPVQPIHSQLKHSAPPFKPASQLVVSPTSVQVCLFLGDSVVQWLALWLAAREFVGLMLPCTPVVAQ